MASFFRYLRDLFRAWWAVGGALSLIAFFIPTLNNYPLFIVAVAVVAFTMAGFRLHQQQVRSKDDRICALTGEHARQIEEVKAQHDAVIAEFSNKVSRLEAEIADLRRPKFTEETRQVAEAAYRKLDRTQKVALRHLLVTGDITDRQALNYLHSKGMAMNYGSIFSALSEAGLVQRVMQDRQRAEHVTGYTGNYTVAPRFRDVLTDLVRADAESTA
jgi:hypothetical protein